MDEKYAKLLLEKCLDLKNSSYLFIHYPKEIESFVITLETVAHKMNIEIKKEREDQEYLTRELINTPLDKIKDNPLFSRSTWNKVAKENGAILFLETVLEDPFIEVPISKFQELMKTRRNSKPIYDQKRDSGELSWCIAAYPSEYWANRLFPNEKDGFDKLLELIFKVCMVDRKDPVLSWNKELEQNKKKIEYLNSLNISKLHYENSLGTDFTVGLPSGYTFCSAGELNYYGEEVIVNMPSYEVFTSPDYRTTEGIIKSSRPLFYQGRKIDEFTLTFSEGKVISVEAKEGKEILEGIVNGETTSSYLGEVAFVDYNSPISLTGKVFETTLLDENASCHIALGSGFSETLISGNDMTEEERYEKGVNKGKTHVDFMIGTEDLNITAITHDGKKVPVFVNGNFVDINNQNL